MRLLIFCGLLLCSARCFNPTGAFARRNAKTNQIVRAAMIDDDDDFFPNDPAHTTPQLMAALWDQIKHGASMEKGDAFTVIYPEMVEDLNTPRYLNLLLAHLDACKDVCDHFGITTAVVPYADKKQGDQVTGFTVKSHGTPKDNYENFEYDPFWDDGTEFDKLYEGIDAEAEAKEGTTEEKDVLPEIENPVPDSDDEIIEISKSWVSTMMTDMGLCPFTSGPEQAGLPVGPVHYEVDRSSTVEDVYAKYWNEVVRVEVTKEKDLSTTLLVLPEFMLGNVELFETFTNTLTQALTPLETEDLLQLVFFHPHWVFRDGNARAGSGKAANYARRSPWPMINLLRTKQVRAAQRGIPTGLVYQQNEKTLGRVGVKKLETMLRLRDWSDNDVKVNRKDYEALKLAKDFQKSGSLDEADLSLAADATPAANKLTKEQQGDLVKVLQQALEKRLGIDSKGSNSGVIPLSGPETSAACMAGDVLIDRLNRLAEIVDSGKDEAARDAEDSDGSPKPKPKPTSPHSIEEDIVVKDTNAVPDELQAARDARIAEARKALEDELLEEATLSDVGVAARGDETTDAIFGKGGILDSKDDEDEDDD